MKPRHSHLATQIGIALGALIAGHAQAQVVFSENFTPPAPATCNSGAPFTYFPSGWTLANVDNKTPASGVNYVTNAWIVREDFANDPTQCAAFSTSWYSPAGAANDFMCTPAIAMPASPKLTWRGLTYDPSYPDGYEVRVMTVAPTGSTGNIGNLLTNSTVVFSTPAENTTWTPHTVDLAAYAGQSAYICFRNPSNDEFLLLIDDVTVANVAAPDLATQAPDKASEYAKAPYWFNLSIPRRAHLVNAGGTPLTNVTLQAETLTDSVVTSTDTSTPPIATLATGADVQVTVASTKTMDAVGVWQIRYTGHATESGSDAVPANDVILSSSVQAVDAELARDDGVTVGSLGIGAGNGGELGQQFDLSTGVTLQAVRYVLNDVPPGMPGDPPYAGGPVTAVIHAWDATNSKPGAVLYTSAPFTATAVGATVDAMFTPKVSLPAGRYVVTVTEPTTATLALATANNVFTLATTWINWPTNPFGDWAHSEDFGVSFAKSFRISLVFDRTLLSDGFEDPPAGVLARPNVAPSTSSGDAAARRNPGRLQRLSEARPGAKRRP